MTPGWSEDACLEAIDRVAEIVDESPTISQYHEHKRSHDPSVKSIKRACGSWNAAKEELGLETFEKGAGFPNYRHAGTGRHGQGDP